MSLPSSPAAYLDCYHLYERAVATPGGVRTPFPSPTAAKLFQLRMNQARAIQRDESRRIYPRESPLHGKSEFDAYSVVVREDSAHEFWIYVQPAGVKLDYIESIETGEPLTLSNDEPARQLTYIPVDEELPE